MPTTYTLHSATRTNDPRIARNRSIATFYGPYAQLDAQLEADRRNAARRPGSVTTHWTSRREVVVSPLLDRIDEMGSTVWDWAMEGLVTMRDGLWYSTPAS